VRALQGRLAGFADSLSAFLDDDEGQCRWIEARRGQQNITLALNTAPIQVAPLLRKALFERFATAVLTSATLAVEKKFDYLHERIGLDALVPPERSITLRVDSPFDFAEQALLLTPDDIPDPGTPRYEPATHDAIRRAIETTRGGTFVLFTAYGALNRAHDALAEPLRKMGIEPLRQGDSTRHALLQRFVNEPRAVLFATDSFWEGVDVKGDALRCVIIARLPFRVPSEPIEQARVEAIEARGGDAFQERAIPQAVIKLKQGFGRLIRSADDRGCVLILDSRVVRKRYGTAFLRSLPPARHVRGSSSEVFTAMRKFFA